MYEWILCLNLIRCVNWELQKEISKLDVGEDVLYRPFSTFILWGKDKGTAGRSVFKRECISSCDEPTNHLDAEGRKTVGRYLDSKKGFILVSHDRTLLNACTNYTLAINKTDIQVQKGNFASWYVNKKRQDEFELRENNRLKKGYPPSGGKLQAGRTMG